MRVSLIGFGLAGRVFHAPLIAATPGLELATIVTSNAERAAQARGEHPGATVVASADDAWDDADVVVVATTNDAHAPLALEGARRGMPVVVDKPFATSAEQAEEVVAGGRVTVFQNRRWDGDFLTLGRLHRAGALGDIVLFESRYERFRPEVGSGWRDQPGADVAGGQLFDLGPHLIDQAMQLLGPPVRVYAEVGARRAGAQVDDDAFVALEHAGASGGREPVTIEAGRYEDFYAGVRAWLEDGAPAPVDPHDSLAGLRVLEAARRSAATHDVIDLED